MSGNGAANGQAQQPWWETRADEVERLLNLYPQKRSALMGLLWLAQDVQGHITDTDMGYIAERLDVSKGFVESSCSFYSLYNRRPVGRYVIIVCGNIVCGLCGGEDLTRYLEKQLGVEVGGTTEDGLFTLLVTNECVAACDGAPALQINQEYFHKVTSQRADEIIAELRGGADLIALSDRIGLKAPGAVWEAEGNA